uniref:adenylyltransferase and sulfurtransferase MOCS3 isoform X2 n=1 Tax=Myxine glutinosa TaxID=7769 RepID=UPI00358F87FD
MAAPEDCSVLQAALVEREREIAKLKSQINNLKGRGSCDQLLDQGVPVFDEREVAALPRKTTLSRDQIGRYSRQLVLPELGVQGQLRLANTAVLVVGCGGLGSPLAQYVAAAGIGRLGLVDHDAVEVNNLHRQVLHSERRLGWSKARSAAHTVQQLNSDVDCIPYHLELCASNAVELIKQYNIVADCSDNVPTRYLVSDACVLAQVPLVSASALRMEGQLTVYCCKGGPCYRCINPEPPSPDTVTNCADGGVFGVVPGVMGSLQALEVLKIAAVFSASYSERLLLFDGLSGRFRTVRIRGRQKHCIACGDSSLIPPLPDYESWCGTTANDKCRHLMLLNKEERIEVQLTSGSILQLTDFQENQVHIQNCTHNFYETSPQPSSSVMYQSLFNALEKLRSEELHGVGRAVCPQNRNTRNCWKKETLTCCWMCVQPLSLKYALFHVPFTCRWSTFRRGIIKRWKICGSLSFRR